MNRRFSAVIQRHNGNVGQLNFPTYQIDDDWETILPDWRCEFRGAGGGETNRGQQVTTETTHIAIGDYWSAANVGVDTDCRLWVAGKKFHVVRTGNPDGAQREMEIEVRRER